MRKIIFLDVDGTLVNDNGIVPESAKMAVQKARKNGHLAYICTGRSKAELFSEILEVGFDGIIGAAGAYIEVNEQILLHERIKEQQLEHVVDYFNQRDIDFYLEANSGLYASKNGKAHLRAIIQRTLEENPQAEAEIQKGLMPFHDALIEGKDLIRNDINKVSFLSSDTPITQIIEEFSATFTVIPSTVTIFGPNSGELSIPDIHKATAIEKVLKHLDIQKEHTYAYGDGINDMEMLRYVEYGIAMGNAKEALKEIADDITDTHDKNGIYNSFLKYGLI